MAASMQNSAVRIAIGCIFITLVIIQFPKLWRPINSIRTNISHGMSHDVWRDLFHISKILLRYTLFSFCMVSYFWDNESRDSLSPSKLSNNSNPQQSSSNASPIPNGNTNSLLNSTQLNEDSVSPSSSIPSSEDSISSSNSSSSSNSDRVPSFFSLFDGYTDFGLDNFLQIGFTAFWPRHTVSQPIIRCSSRLALFAFPLLRLGQKFGKFLFLDNVWRFLGFLRLIKTVTGTALLWMGIYLGMRFFQRPPLYTQDVTFASMPWQKYRNQYTGSCPLSSSSSGSSNRNSRNSFLRRATSSKWILAGLVVTALLEAYLMEIQHLNQRIDRSTSSRKVFVDGAEADRSDFIMLFYQFVTGNWHQVLLPVFVYPEVILLVITCSLLPTGSKVLKGLMTYCLLIAGHSVMVTILSLVIVWEIERFDRDLRHNMICIFQRNPNLHSIDGDEDEKDNEQENALKVRECARNRLHVFDQMKIKRDELIPQLSTLFHYLVIDRVVMSVLDFWVWTCDRKIEFNVAAFITRHSFQLVLMCWVVYKMAKFNRKWPHQLIDTATRWRLQNWIQSGGGMESGRNGKERGRTENVQYEKTSRFFLDHEYALWEKYLSQERFVRRFGFRVFGYRVDIRWFTLSFGFQFGLLLAGMSQGVVGTAPQQICFTS